MCCLCSHYISSIEGKILPSRKFIFSEICGDAAAVQALKGEGFGWFIFLDSTSLRYFIFKL